MDYHGNFATQGSVLVAELIDWRQREKLKEYVYGRLLCGKMHPGDPSVSGSPCMYGDRVVDGLLEQLMPDVHKVVECELFPTYSYTRLYRRGATLAPHYDRAACEISVSLTVDFDSPDPWPLWLEDDTGPHAVIIPRGGGVVYAGPRMRHWREEFNGNWALQLFLHYVDKRGPYSGLRFDGRSRLGTPKN